MLDSGAGSWRTVIRGGSQAQYVSSGHLVYVAGGALWAVAFDLRTAADRLAPLAWWCRRSSTLPTGVAEFDIARDGTLVYVARRHERCAAHAGVGRPPGARAADRRAAAALRQRAPVAGRHARRGRNRGRSNDIWVWDCARETLTRVTSDPGRDESPVWTPDGRRLVFTTRSRRRARRAGGRPPTAAVKPEQLGDGSRIQRASSVTPDGRQLLLSDGRGLTTVALDGSREMRPLATLARGGGDGAVSPDGRWVAYVELDGGAPNVFVSRFAAPGEGRTLVTPEGGAQPRWSPDGRELFYLGLDGALMSVEVSPGDAFSAARPRAVVEQELLLRHQRVARRHLRRRPRRTTVPDDPRGHCRRGSADGGGRQTLVRGTEAAGADQPMSAVVILAA